MLLIVGYFGWVLLQWLHTKNGRELPLEREPRDSCFFSTSDLSAQFTVCERQRESTPAGWRAQVGRDLASFVTGIPEKWLFCHNYQFRRRGKGKVRSFSLEIFLFFILYKVLLRTFIGNTTQQHKELGWSITNEHKMCFYITAIFLDLGIYWAPAFHFTHDCDFTHGENTQVWCLNYIRLYFCWCLTWKLPFSLLKSSGFSTALAWTASQNQLRRTGGRGVTAGESLSASVCQRVFERVREHRR